MEKWTLSDPGRLGSEAHRPALSAGREPYDPDGGRSGYFRPVSGLAPRAFVFRGMYLLEWDLCLVVPEGLEVRDPAGLDFRGIPVPGLAPGVVYDPGVAVTEERGRLARRLGVEVGQEHVGEGAVTGVGDAARDVDVASAGARTISSARRLASLTPQAGRSRRGGFRQGGFPPAVENREEPFERPRAGRVRALGGGRVLRQKPNDTAKPRRLLAKSGATVTRRAAPVGW